MANKKTPEWALVALLALFVNGCDSIKSKVRCGVVKRTVAGDPGFWGSSVQTAVDIGDRVVTASGGRSLVRGDKACVQLYSDGGPFITSEEESK